MDTESGNWDESDIFEVLESFEKIQSWNCLRKRPSDFQTSKSNSIVEIAYQYSLG